MAKGTRRGYSQEFKREAVALLQAGGAVTEVARQLDVHPTMLRRWERKLTEDPATAFPGNGRRGTPPDEVAQLRKELAQVRAERDFLKKTAAYFAEHSR